MWGGAPGLVRAGPLGPAVDLVAGRGWGRVGVLRRSGGTPSAGPCQVGARSGPLWGGLAAAWCGLAPPWGRSGRRGSRRPGPATATADPHPPGAGDGGSPVVGPLLGQLGRPAARVDCRTCSLACQAWRRWHETRSRGWYAARSSLATEAGAATAECCRRGRGGASWTTSVRSLEAAGRRRPTWSSRAAPATARRAPVYTCSRCRWQSLSTSTKAEHRNARGYAGLEAPETCPATSSGRGPLPVSGSALAPNDVWPTDTRPAPSRRVTSATRSLRSGPPGHSTSPGPRSSAIAAARDSNGRRRSSGRGSSPSAPRGKPVRQVTRELARQLLGHRRRRAPTHAARRRGMRLGRGD